MNRFVRRPNAFLLLGALLSLALPQPYSDALIGGVVVVSMLVAVRAAKKLQGSSGWRVITAGGVLLGFGPTLSGFDLGFVVPWTFGDVAAVVGYLLFVAGLERVLRARTLAVELAVVLDAALLAAWMMTLALVAFGEAVRDRLDTPAEVAAFSYLPFTVLLIFQVLRLVLGTPTRSVSFVLLTGGVAAAAISEILFLAAAAGIDALRAAAVVAATVGLVLLSGAVADPSAPELEQPVSGAFRSFSKGRGAAIISSLVVLVAIAVTPIGSTAPIRAGLAVIAVLMSARIYLLLFERDQWVIHERNERQMVAEIMEAEEEDAVFDRAVAALGSLLASKKLSEVDFWRSEGHRWFSIAGEDREAEILEATDLDTAVSTRQAQRTEFMAEPVKKYMSRLAIPVVSQPGRRVALLVETLPVLDGRQVSQIESIASNVKLSLAALDLREESHRRRADQRFRALVQDSNDIVALVNAETGLVEMVGPTLERLVGRSESDYVGGPPLRFLHSDDRTHVDNELAAVRGDTELDALDVRMKKADGRYHWFAVSVRDLADEDEISGRLYSFADINDRKMAELQLLSSEGRYRALVKNSKDVFALVDDESRITFVSPNVEQLLGFSQNDLIGTHVRGLLTQRGAAILQDALNFHDGDLENKSLELELRTASGEVRTVEAVFSDPGLAEDEGSLVTVRDITEQRRLEDSLRHQTLYDPLTGLFNRASIYPELQQALQRLGETETLGVLHLNVVDFKEINESVGFGRGDELLVEIASRLRAVLRGGDAIARLNADEFAVVSSAQTRGRVVDLASRLLAIFDEPFPVGDRMIEVRAVLGLDASDNRRQNATTILENAALAMRVGRMRDNEITVFEESMRSEASERFELAADLRGAIDDGQFSLVYQPLFSLDSNQVTSVEALLRWNHPERGHVSPGVFIPLAERTGAIVELGRWVLLQACEQLRDWHADLPDGSGLSMAVNVSAQQLENDGEAQTMIEIIRRSGVDPNKLTLELTESTLIADADWLRVQLDDFRALGIKIAVDDFGTGAAGLGHLRDVPFDVLKIDKSYIDNLETSTDACNLVAGVIELAHGMQTRTVAEGIETPVQASLLRQMGCDYGQGFYLGRPMAQARLEEWFAQGREGAVAAAIATEAVG